MSWLRRVKRELTTFSSPHVHEIKICSDKPEIIIFKLIGPKSSIYSGYMFDLVVKITPDYPLRAPSVQLSPPLLHPSVDEKGHICSDSIDWRCEMTLATLIGKIIDILRDLRPRDTSLNLSLSALLLSDSEGAKRQISDHLAKNAEKIPSTLSLL